MIQCDLTAVSKDTDGLRHDLLFLFFINIALNILANLHVTQSKDSYETVRDMVTHIFTADYKTVNGKF